MADTTTVPQLLTEKATAKLLDIAPAALRQDRHYRMGLPFVKIGRRVRYRADDIAAYIAANTVTPS